jgi:hypothetical protein
MSIITRRTGINPMKCPTCGTEVIPKIRIIRLDDSCTVLLLDEGQDLDALLTEWQALDTGVVGWLPFSDWIRSRGVTVIDTLYDGFEEVTI